MRHLRRSLMGAFVARTISVDSQKCTAVSTWDCERDVFSFKKLRKQKILYFLTTILRLPSTDVYKYNFTVNSIQWNNSTSLLYASHSDVQAHKTRTNILLIYKYFTAFLYHIWQYWAVHEKATHLSPYSSLHVTCSSPLKRDTNHYPHWAFKEKTASKHSRWHRWHIQSQTPY